MKKRWYSILDSVKFSIAVLLVGTLLIGIGNIPTNVEFLKTTFDILSYIGKEIKELFPLAVVINYIGKTYKDITAVIGGIICYVGFNIVTMFAAGTNYNDAYYYSVLGIRNGNLMPLNLGLLTSIIVIIIILTAYKTSRKRYNYGLLNFIDNDVWFFIIVLLATIVSGYVVCLIAPRFITFFQRGLRFISKNNTNPALLFVYGCVDKGLQLFGNDNITKQQFLFDSLGGTWVNSYDITIAGDVNIWTAQAATGAVGKAVGKFITPSYLINIFSIPSLILAFFFNITDKMDKKRAFGLIFIGIITSLLTASSLPLEYVLLFTSPLLLVIHILLTGSAYMILSMQGIYLGYNYVGDVASMCMGNIFDLIYFINNVDFYNMAINLIKVGVVYFVIYQLITYIYYKRLALEFLEPETRKYEVREIIDALGGLDNIKMITSSIFTVTVVLNDKEKLNSKQLIGNKAYKVKERYFGYIISFGPSSSSIRSHINKELKDYKECLKYSAK